MPENAITTLLVEDQTITRLGIKIMLEEVKSLQIVGEASSGNEAIKKAIELKPELVVMDIGLPDLDGIEATRMIKESSSSKVLMLTSHDSDEDVLAAILAGADAYCLKDTSSARIQNAIAAVMDGAIWLDPQIAGTLLQLLSRKPEGPVRQTQPQTKPLSEREHEILCMLVEGLSNQQMAEKLFLSTETVKTHMRHLMEKLQVTGRTQAAVKAVREGLVAEPTLSKDPTSKDPTSKDSN